MIAFYGIDTPKNKYAFLNIVYFDLAYIRLMHKLNWIFGFFLSAFWKRTAKREDNVTAYFLFSLQFWWRYSIISWKYPIQYACRIEGWAGLRLEPYKELNEKQQVYLKQKRGLGNVQFSNPRSVLVIVGFGVAASTA